MTVFNSYATGTVSVAAGGTTVTGTGTTWSGINAKSGDDLIINGFTAVVMDVIDATHLTIKPWPYAAQTTQPYAIVWRSPLRYVGGQAMADVDSLIQYLTGGIFPTISGGSASSSTLVLQSTSGAGTTDAIMFKTGAQVLRELIDSSGKVTFGAAATNTAGGFQAQVSINASSASFGTGTFAINRFDASSTGPQLYLAKSRNGAIGGHTALVLDDNLGYISLAGSDGVQFLEGATIAAKVDGTVGINDMPTRLEFATTNDGSPSPTRKLLLSNSGVLVLGNTAPLTNNVFADLASFQVIHTGIVGISRTGSAGGFAPTIYFTKTRNASNAAHTIVNIDDGLGFVSFDGDDGANYPEGAAILAEVDGTPAAGSMPGRLRLKTTPSGAGVAVDRVRLDSKANVIIGTAAIATNATDGFLYVPTCAGTPTGTPTSFTGRAPIVINSTNNKLYFYSSGAWRDAGP